LHRLTVTGCNVNYEGSMTVDADLLKAAGMVPGERVQVVDINNGARFETYVIEGDAGSGVVCLNGGAAKLGKKGDLVIVIAYGLVDEREMQNHRARIVLVDKNNRIKK